MDFHNYYSIKVYDNNDNDDDNINDNYEYIDNTNIINNN